MQSESDAQWCLNAVQTAETFERLLGLASAFILDGQASYKADTVFVEVRQAYAAKLHAFDFHPDNVRAVASRDPVRGLEDYIANGWSDVGPKGLITEADMADFDATIFRPAVNPTPPRAIGLTVKAGHGASNFLFER